MEQKILRKYLPATDSITKIFFTRPGLIKNYFQCAVAACELRGKKIYLFASDRSIKKFFALFRSSGKSKKMKIILTVWILSIFMETFFDGDEN